eukprot:m.21787 g.21787  ORF g.21787 m.21787 type:complete len:505 (-) comp13535_c0_seq1:28-1542(-)
MTVSMALLGVFSALVTLTLTCECDLPHQAARFKVCARDFGAIANGVADDTQAIQATIDHAVSLLRQHNSTQLVQDTTHALSPPVSCAVLSLGVFLSGTVFLRPGVVLFVDRTAVLKASLNSSLFPHDEDWPYQAALVVGKFADNSGVAGGGVLDGQAPQFVTGLDLISDQYTFSEYNGGANGPFRLRLLDFRHSRSVSVTDVTLTDATSFHAHFLNCTSVLVERVTVSSDLRWPNCDGIDITSCNNTIIRQCTIRTGDDAISPKTWQGYGPLVNLLIEDTMFHSRSGGIHFGASAWYDYINITVRRVRVIDAHGGLLVQVRGPGSIRGLFVSNLLVSHTTFNAPCHPWMGNAHPISISADRWAGGPAGGGVGSVAGTISNLVFENVTAQSENGIFVSGRVGGVENVVFNQITLIIQQTPNNNGSFGPCPAHNYWPTSEPGGWDGTVAPIDGFYVESATNVTIDGVAVSFVGVAKPGNTFGKCVRADPNTTHDITVGKVRCVGET